MQYIGCDNDGHYRVFGHLFHDKQEPSVDLSYAVVAQGKSIRHCLIAWGAEFSV